VTIQNTSCKRVYIVEGPDGGGKSTFALALAEALGTAIVSHHGPYPNITTPAALARIYVDAMIPALTGEYDVVMDRSWLSEPIYGEVYRGGVTRIDSVTQRQLERLALRCGAVVINCRVPWEKTLATWEQRKGVEYLKTADALREVWELYGVLETSLLQFPRDYTVGGPFVDPRRIIKEVAYQYVSPPHPLNQRTAGDWNAHIVLVGEAFAALKDGDHSYQWPFGSFHESGCSRWLTRQLDSLSGTTERDLLWVNADQLDPIASAWLRSKNEVIALGVKASVRLTDLGINHRIVPHPQSWKRFHYQDVYPLLKIRSILS